MKVKGDKKILHKSLSVIMTVIMLFTMIPTTTFVSFAAELQPYEFVVNDSEGTAVEGAVVSLVAEGASSIEKSTDSEGKCLFDIDSDTKYSYTIIKIGYVSASGNLDVNKTDAYVLTSKTVVSACGTVINSNSEPVKDASVVVTDKDGIDITVITEENGSFTVANLYKEDNYSVKVQADGYKVYSGNLNVGADTEIVLADKETVILKFAEAEKTISFGTVYTNVASSVFGQADEYTSSDVSVATVDNTGKVTCYKVGQVVITATKNETADSEEAVCQYTLTIEKGVQDSLVWESAAPATMPWNEKFTNKASGGTGNGVITYEITEGEDIASIDAQGELVASAPGKVVVVATKNGGENYNDITATYTITFVKADQKELVFDDPSPADIYYGDSFKNIATGGSVQGAVIEYSGNNSSVATVNSDGSLVLNGYGTITVTAKIPATDLYNEVTAEYTVRVLRADQKTAFKFDKTADNQSVVYGNAYTNAASGGDGDGVIVYASSDVAIATVDKNGVVTPLKAGKVTITATKEADNRYNEAKTEYTLVVNKADQTVVFDIENIPDDLVYGVDFINKATAETEITYSSSDPSRIDVDENGKLIVKKAGDAVVVISATAKETEQYNSAKAQYSVSVAKAEHTVSYKDGDYVKVTFNDNDNKFTINVDSVGAPGVSKKFMIAQDVNSIVDNFDSKNGTFDIKGAGEVLFTFTLFETDLYETTMDSFTLLVEPDEQKIIFEKDKYEFYTGEDFEGAVAEAADEKLSGEGKITYSIKNDNGIIKSLNPENGKIELTYLPGTATIAATKAACKNYKEATAEYTIVVKEWKPSEDYFEIEGQKNANGNEWFIGNISIKADENYSLSFERENGKAEWLDELIDVVTENTDDKSVSFFVKDEATGYISEAVSVTLKKDSVVPSGVITIKSESLWQKVLSFFRLNENEQGAAIDVTYNDALSGIGSVEYFIDYDSVDVMIKEQLDEISEWETYTPDATVADNEKAVVYAKITDNAGNYIYVTTNGIIVDSAAPVLDVRLPIDNRVNDYFVENIIVPVSVEDAAPSSGIKEISYTIYCDGAITKQGTLYELEEEDPAEAELIAEWNSEEAGTYINIDAAVNNSDNVKLVVTVCDNSGNVTTVEEKLKFSIKAPEISVDIVDFDNPAATVSGKKYFTEAVKAIISVTGRNSLFNKDGLSISVTGKNYTWEKAWEQKSAQNPGEIIYSTEIIFTADSEYSFTVNYNDLLGAAATEYKSETFGIDLNAPIGTVTVGESTWDKLIETLTFGLYSNSDIEYSITVADTISGIKSVEYFVTDGKTALNEDELNAINAWKAYAAPITVSADAIITVYAKITDNVNKCVYISSDGYIVDKTAPAVTVEPEIVKDIYTEDVKVNVSVTETAPYAGISKVTYTIICDDVITTEETTLFDFAVENPEYSALISEISESITIDAAKNNGNVVKVVVKAVDNAGNSTESEFTCDIDTTAPAIKLKFYNNNANLEKYFSEKRTATITVTERKEHFNKDNVVINVTAMNKDGSILEDVNVSVGEWTTVEGDTVNADTHTAELDFIDDANYILNISYTDNAGLVNTEIDTVDSVAPFEFTVDKSAADASVSVNASKWTELAERSGFAIFSNTAATVSAEYHDDISDIYSVEYCKYYIEQGFTLSELMSVRDWTEYKGSFEITPDDKAYIYLKVTNNAGLVTYVNSGGAIIEATNASIVITPEASPMVNNVYTDDVPLTISVADTAESASGIKSIRYWVECDGKITQESVLYAFEEATPVDYSKLVFSQTVKSDDANGVVVFADKNKGNIVEVFVEVTDNAGNVAVESIKLDIDNTAPVIELNYDNNAPYKVNFFAAERTATIAITERAAHFDADKVNLVITAKDGAGNDLGDSMYEIGSWSTTEVTEQEIAAGKTVDDAVHTLRIKFLGDAVYTLDVSYFDDGGLANDGVDTAESVAPFDFTVDKSLPEATVTIEESTWREFISNITFGLYKNTDVTATVIADDTVSGIESIKYYKETIRVTGLSLDQVKAIPDNQWIAYENAITVSPDEHFIVYVRVVNNSGLVDYFSSDGYITEDNAPAVNFEILSQSADNNIYTDDVEVKITASETQLYSGLKEVVYWVESDSVRTTTADEEVLYSFDVENAEHKDLVAEKDFTITVPADKNKGNEIKVFAKVTDNAGNVDEKSISLDIDNTNPEISVSLDGNAYKLVGDKGYFSTTRKATITVTERTTHFDASLVDINIEARDVDGNLIAGAKPVIGEWQTVEITSSDKKNGSTVDDAKHILTIDFVDDANYTFAVSMTDKGGLVNDGVDTGNSVAPYNFCVDRSGALACVYVDGNKWDEFLGKITFGLYKNEAVNVSAEADDFVSGIETVEYFPVYKEFGNINSVDRLEQLSAGKLQKYTGAIKITEDSRFVYYFKIVNNSGIVKWINSNGYIMEKTGAEIGFEIITEATENGNYNNNVDIKVTVSDIAESTKQNVKVEDLVHLPYSGLKSVSCRTICVANGIETVTDSDDLFVFTDTGINAVADLVDNISETVCIYADKNKGQFVKLEITAIDNAGNETVEELQLVIDNTAPVISIKYNDAAAPYSVIGDRGYFSVAERTAIIEITERTAHFDAVKATEGIKINAFDASGKEIVAEYEISEWAITEGATVDDTVHTAIVTYPAGANYEFSISYTDEATNPAIEIKTNDSYAPYEFTVDNTNPEASVSFHNSIWEEMFNFVTFNIFRNEDSELVLDVSDATSPVDIKYIKTDSVKSYSSLNNLSEDNWSEINDGVLDVKHEPETNKYQGIIKVVEDERLTVYFRVTDKAGNRIFVRSDGIIVDETISTIEFDYTEKDNYNGDIPVKLIVNDDVSMIAKGVYSGLKNVTYWVTSDGIETQRETFDFTITEKNAYENLTHYFEYDITVDSKKNNSSDVKLWVEVTDNAGNITQKNISFDIDITAPSISVNYDNNEAYKLVDSHGYFAAARTATVTITERTVHFDAEKALHGIKIIATDSDGKAVIEDISTIIGEFSTIEGKTADEAKHILLIDYSADANYKFSIAYTDEAGNANKDVDTGDNKAPYSFSVDTVAAEATVTVGKLGFWDKLISTLTFGLWTKDTVKVTGTSFDKISGVESVSYYKTADITALGVSELKKITAWTEFNGIEVSANERFVVYLRVVDNSGNETFISTDGIIVDDIAPVIEDVSPEITITPVQPVNDIYNTDVDFAVKVVDPKSGDSEAFSGLKKITYQVINLGKVTQEGTLYEFDVEAPVYPQLVQSWEDDKAITVSKELNNSNDVEIKVFAEDNSCNTSEVSEKIKIDITSPEISIRFDNNNGDTTFSDNAAFKANRVATIVVTERNFDAELVNVVLSNVFGDVPVLSGWTTVNAAGNGDGATHTANIVFNEDGDYTFEVDCRDKAGNKNNPIDYGNSISPNAFTVDKTAPVFSIVYDNNSAQNGNYYKAKRTATIKLVEHNFETSRVVLKLAATDNGRTAKLPTVSEWVNNGDEHILTICYDTDAHYTFDFEYVDKAGNSISDITEQNFIVDTTLPILTISNIVDESANNEEGNIGFALTATDTNFDTFEPVVCAAYQNDMSLQRVNLGHKVNVSNGQSYIVSNITEDGIYKIGCSVVDKAGNAYSSVTLQNTDGSSYVARRAGNDTLVSFSVNRDGSVFMLGNEYTESIVDKYYIQNVTEDIAIVEINVDVLEDQKVTLNGKELVYGTDYTISVSGGGASWMKYVYTIDKALFENEGEYNIVVSSVDKAENNAFSDIKNAEIKFVVDRTAPVVSVSGLETKGRYQTEVQTVTIIPTDDGGSLNTLKVVLVDENGNAISELINLQGEELETALLENDGKITFEIQEGLYQNIRIICTDCSVNADGENGVYDELFNEVSVSPQAILIFWAFKPLRYGTIGGIIGVAALIFVFIAKKKKKTEN